MKRTRVILAALLLTIHGEASAGDAIISSFGPDIYDSDTSAMDVALGIDGNFVVEDFEDTSLIPDLSIALTFRNGDSQTVTSLPSVRPSFISAPWDGISVLISVAGNEVPDGGQRASMVTFNLSPPALAMGVGGGSFQSGITGHVLWVNGTPQGLLEDLAGPNWSPNVTFGRNGYLTIRAQAGELLQSVGIENINSSGSGEDYLEFDHLAVQRCSQSEDFDNDGVVDSGDNCLAVANPDQRDTDADGFGNRCDADLDNDGRINFVDLNALKSVFFATGDLDADFDGDMRVNFNDLSIMKEAFFGAPGPSCQ